jgi:RNA polymerase sigma-70 factor (ECF subfamily)
MQASMRDADELVLLLTQCAAGDRRALRTLYDRTAPALFARVLRLVRDRAAAEEILQETYVSVWRNAGRYDRNASAPMTWLAAIARYRALDVIQRRRPDLSLEESGVAETAADPAASPLDAAVASAERRALMECLNELEGEARRSIELAFWRGLSYAEVAAVTKHPEGTVKSWIRRGLQRLRSCLER